ncbi:hypothetical protein B0J14DRAFT_608219 [Halenospora varia]|nr:hypothetical protein B0J14DRAFT_608219 [Halenospora varia]
MEAAPPLNYIDPSLPDIDFLNVNAGFTVPLDNPSPLTSNSDLNQILDNDQILSAVPQPPPVPYDEVWNTQHHEESIRLLHRNSILSEYPFPPVVDRSSNDKTSSDQALLVGSCPPPSKRRGRKRKARLSEAEKKEKHRKFLERNRLAASKCRAKKKTEIEHLEENKRVLERENPLLRSVIRQLWNEVRFYRKAVMSHGSCNHADLIDWVERNAESSAALDARCQSLLAEETARGLDCEGSPNSSIDDSAQTSTFSVGRESGRSSISSFTSRPTSPTSTRKDSVV